MRERKNYKIGKAATCIYTVTKPMMLYVYIL